MRDRWIKSATGDRPKRFSALRAPRKWFVAPGTGYGPGEQLQHPVNVVPRSQIGYSVAGGFARSKIVGPVRLVLVVLVAARMRAPMAAQCMSR